MSVKTRSGAKTQQRCDFAKYLIEGFETKEAYVKAGFKDSKNSPVESSRLKSHEDVICAMKYWQRLKYKKIDISTNGLLEKMSQFAAFNIKDLFDDRGAILPIHALPDHITYAIKQIDVRDIKDKDGNVKETVYKYITYDKMDALKQLKEFKELQLEEFALKNGQSGEVKIKLNVNNLQVKIKNTENKE